MDASRLVPSRARSSATAARAPFRRRLTTGRWSNRHVSSSYRQPRTLVAVECLAANGFMREPVLRIAKRHELARHAEVLRAEEVDRAPAILDAELVDATLERAGRRAKKELLRRSE